MEQIDRQSAIGKRDYAMVLLTTRLGLRVGDLRRLELGWFDWRAKTLALTQHKTGVPLTLPLPADVGWAVIDYVRHGRPEAACREVFVKHRYPFTAFGSSTSAGCRLGYYSRRAGIVFAPERSHGLHSLRGALAVAMLQAERRRRSSPRFWVTRWAPRLPRTTSDSTPSICAAAHSMSKMSSQLGRGTVMSALTLGELVDTRSGPSHRRVRYESQARVLAQFVEHCRREGYADGSLIREAVEGFLYGRHLKASTIRREETVLRDLAEHARQFGWQAWSPPTLTLVKSRHQQPPYVFSDEEIRRLFQVIDTQPLSEMSNRALVDQVLFQSPSTPPGCGSQNRSTCSCVMST